MPPAPAAPPITGPAAAAAPSPSEVGFDAKFSDLEDAPSPSPAPNPTPAPDPRPEPSPTPAPEPKPAEKPSTPPKDPATGKFTKPDDKPAPAKPADKPAPDEFTPPSVATGSQLRKFAEQAGTRARQAASEVVRL